MIKAIIFDADGVLINGEPFKKFLELDHGLTTEHTKQFFMNEFQDCLVGKADLAEAIAPHLVEWGYPGTVGQFLDYWFSSEHSIDQDLINYILVLKNRGIKSFVATNQEKLRTQYMIEKMGFGKVFEKIYSSADLGIKKPDQAFFEAIYKDLTEFSKDELLFWDNTAENVESAINFGIRGEVYTDFADFLKVMDVYKL